jgi:Holliday junction resolvase
VYDRQEVNEIVRYLHDAGFAAVRGGSGLPADDEEEKQVCLFVGSRHWYQV